MEGTRLTINLFSYLVSRPSKWFIVENAVFFLQFYSLAQWFRYLGGLKVTHVMSTDWWCFYFYLSKGPGEAGRANKNVPTTISTKISWVFPRFCKRPAEPTWQNRLLKLVWNAATIMLRMTGWLSQSSRGDANHGTYTIWGCNGNDWPFYIYIYLYVCCLTNILEVAIKL